MKAMWLWQNRRLLNSQVGFFTLLLLKRRDVTPSLSHNTSMLVISHTGKWKNWHLRQTDFTFIYTEKQTLFPISNYRQVLFNHRHFYHTYSNKEQAIANGVLWCRTGGAWLSLAQTHLPRGKRCALNLAGDKPAATGQPRSRYEETVHIVNPDLSHWAESALQLHKGCTAFSRNYNCKGAPAEQRRKKIVTKIYPKHPGDSSAKSLGRAWINFFTCSTQRKNHKTISQTLQTNQRNFSKQSE